jgi:uncharacterized membrane protein YqgA involved in biofilm formation
MRWDRAAIASGAVVALVLAVPLSIGARVAADRDQTSLAVWLSLGAVIGFMLGAACAAWAQRAGTPLSHGLITAGATYLAAQTVFVAVKLIRSASVSWYGIFFNLSVVLVAGLIGGVLGRRLRERGVVPRAERRHGASS